MILPTNLRRTTLTSPDDHDRHFRGSLALLSSARTSLSQALEQVAETIQDIPQETRTGSTKLDKAINLTLQAETHWIEYQIRQAGGVTRAIDFVSIHDNFDRIIQEPQNLD